ncbi:hypothetical protein Barb6_01049 [Bacteroidales bacterium Barb6]|nr:hypothetical protein Barb6_01049 [Bacteroidales bacterium Barb6]
MAGFLARSPFIGRLPKARGRASVATRCAGVYRTYSYGYSSGLSPDSLLLTSSGQKTLHHNLWGQK